MRRCRPVVAAILALALLCPAGMARGDGESKAPEKLGKVTFATSCDPKVQAKFERAVALLHSFWYREGRETFESVLADDGTCAIATWGVAAVLMSNPIAGLGPAPKAAADAQAAESFVRAKVASAPQEAALRSVMASMSGCLTQGLTLEMSRAILDGVLSEALYRRVTLGTMSEGSNLDAATRAR